MNGFKKTCNILGIIFACILSIIFVAGLAVLPLILTALSVTEPSNAGNVLTYVDISEFVPSESDNPQTDVIIRHILASDATKEVAQLYVQDIYNALGGTNQEQLLTTEKLQQITEEHMDDLVKIVQESDALPEYSEEEIRQAIRTAVETQSDMILAELPDVQQFAEDVVGENAKLQIFFRILSQKDKVETILIALMVVLAVLIFLCRLPKWKGFPWLAADLYIAVGLLIVQYFLVEFGVSVVLNNVLFAFPVTSLIPPLVATFQNGLLSRTEIMLAVAVLLTVISILIWVIRKKWKTDC